MLELFDGSVLLVRPRAPFVEWACGLGGDVTQEAVLGYAPVAYLVPDVDDLEQLLRRAPRWVPRVFESELSGWSTDPAEWPERRDLRAFRRWFEFELAETVRDVR